MIKITLTFVRFQVTRRCCLKAQQLIALCTVKMHASTESRKTCWVTKMNAKVYLHT